MHVSVAVLPGTQCYKCELDHIIRMFHEAKIKQNKWSMVRIGRASLNVDYEHKPYIYIYKSDKLYLQS